LLGTIQDTDRLFKIVHVTDHWQQQAEIPEADIRAQCGTQLG
jgi:hypothetical protein